MVALQHAGRNVYVISVDKPHWADIGPAAAAIHIVDDQLVFVVIVRVYFQQQTFFANHVALVTATVEVTDDTPLQVPLWPDRHLRSVVAAVHTGVVEFIAGEVALKGGELDLRLQVI